MAQIIIEIQDENYQQVVDAICLIGGYQETVDDGSGLNVMIENPQTKDEYVVAHLKKTLVEKMQLAKSMQERQASPEEL